MRNVDEEFQFDLGLKAKDSITGFVGTITGVSRYITGCDLYLLAPPIDKDGKHVAAKWFDDNRITILKSKKKKVRDQDNGGACESAPVK